MNRGWWSHKSHLDNCTTGAMDGNKCPSFHLILDISCVFNESASVMYYIYNRAPKKSTMFLSLISGQVGTIYPYYMYIHILYIYHGFCHWSSQFGP